MENIVAADRQLVDRIIYLESLASDSSVVDPLMDDLRLITAHWQADVPLDDQDRLILLKLESQIKGYLIKKDSLRAFNATTLQERLHKWDRDNKRRESGALNINGFWTVLMFASVSAAATLLVPAEVTVSFRISIFAPVFFLSLSIGTAWLYLSALQGFNKEFRRAFLLFCIGILLFIPCFTHYAVIQWFQLGENPILKYGGITFFVTLCFAFMYFGLAKYAQLLKLKTHLSSRSLILSVSAFALVLGMFLPHPGVVDNEVFFDIAFVSALWALIFVGSAAVLAKDISKKVTPAYSVPMKWIFWYLVILGLGGVLATVSLFWVGRLNGEMLSYMLLIAGMPQQILLLYAGYVFNREIGR